MEPLFQSQTEYTFDEFKRYNREILYKVRKVNKTIIMLEVILLVVAFLTKNLTYAASALLVLLIFKLTFSLQEKRAYRKNPQLHNMIMTHRFYGDYIEQESKFGVVTIFHYQIRDVLETRTNFYLLTASNGTIMIVKEHCSEALLEHLGKLKVIKMGAETNE